jgi:DNA-binding response OmpR family regulator
MCYAASSPARTIICRSPLSCQSCWRASKGSCAAAIGSNANRPETCSSSAAAFEFSGRVIDFDNLELTVGDRKLQLTLMEGNLLRYLIDKQGQVASRQKLLEEVWGVREDTDTRAIDNFVVRLRRYIEDDPSQPRHLLTVRGVGYRFVAN